MKRPRHGRIRTLSAVTAVVAAVAVLATLAPAPAEADGPVSQLASPVWLCRPGMPANPCGQDESGQPRSTAGSFTAQYPVSHERVPLDVTEVAGVHTERAGGPASVDCFYVYPTVDILPNPLAQVGSLPPVPTDEEFAQTIAQIGMFAPQCRLFVPEYRQATLGQLAASVITKVPPDYSTGIMDVEQAWHQYWAHDNLDPASNRRRGVILLGHSQGTGVLTALLRREFDGDTEQRHQLVSAVLLGGHVQVPVGLPAGGGSDPKSTFQHLPACTRDSATAPVPLGCVIAYSSYKPGVDQPLPQDADLARIYGETGHRVLCVNPAGLLAGTGDRTPLDTISYTRRLVGGSAANPYGRINGLGQTLRVPDLSTGYARYRGVLTGQCRTGVDSSGTSSWLDIAGGDQLVGPPSSAFYGLHAIDFTVTAGDLSTLLSAQTVAWLATR
ncbi:MAG: DUF3089 domain-containing protein [Kutzneria sp.]|nr:DUF3089 domain-containing protein [Kutzneria sp.]